jgi:hypothetical protein
MQRVERRRLAACDRIVDQVPLPVPFNINRYVRALEASRGRPIRLKYWERVASFDPSHPYGCWLACEDEDRFYLRPDTSPLHQAFIFLHEVGHMQYGHDRGAGPIDAAFIDALFSNPEQVGSRRRMFSDTEEEDAELFATRVMERAVISPVWRPDGRSRDLVARLSESLAHPVRRERVRG